MSPSRICLTPTLPPAPIMVLRPTLSTVLTTILAPTLTAVLILLASVPERCSAATGLQSDQIAVIVNRNNADSRKIAEYYCRRRQVPTSNIISVAMPQREIIDRSLYEDHIAPAIRQRLNSAEMAGRIRCLLTVYGVPLRIKGKSPAGEQRELRNLLNKLIDERFGELEQLTSDFEALSAPGAVGPATEPNNKKKIRRMPRGQIITRQKKARKLLEATVRAGEQAQLSLRNGPQGTRDHRRRVQRFEKLIQQMMGLRGVTMAVARRVSLTFNAADKETLQRQLEQYQARLKEIKDTATELRAETFDVTSRQRLYELVYEAEGLKNLCMLLLNDRLALDDEESQSSFDSELSLILWDSYPLRLWQPNQLNVHNSSAVNLAGSAIPDRPTLMVARLDGPRADIAMGLIDKALAAEQMVLNGTAYLDAKGISKNSSRQGSEGYYDMSIRRVGRLLKEQTGLSVVSDNRKELFTVGACPDTILYNGWYSLQRYIDSFEFKLGAVGYHIASFEAETLVDDPNNRIWCKRMLEEGITATLGAVAEPYLHSFPVPDQFFADLISGQYCLVECYYRTKPCNSWMMTLFGDPLYRPHYARVAQLSPLPRANGESTSAQPQEPSGDEGASDDSDSVIKPPPVRTPPQSRPRPRRRLPPGGRGFRPAL